MALPLGALTCCVLSHPLGIHPPFQEHKHWEESFKVYERSVAMFKYPHVRDIWTAYLAQFVELYGGTKLERARDLFEHALSTAPPQVRETSMGGEIRGSD